MDELIPPEAPNPNDSRIQDQQKRIDALEKANKSGSVDVPEVDMLPMLDKLIQVIAEIDQNGKANTRLAFELQEQIKQIVPAVRAAIKPSLVDMSARVQQQGRQMKEWIYKSEAGNRTCERERLHQAAWIIVAIFVVGVFQIVATGMLISTGVFKPPSDTPFVSQPFDFKPHVSP